MYFERQTLKGLGATQQDVLVGTGILTTLFPQYAPQIEKTVTAVYGTAAAPKTTTTKTTTAATGGGITTNQVLLYGGAGLAVLVLLALVMRK